jgi:hypothetical protein
MLFGNHRKDGIWKIGEFGKVGYLNYKDFGKIVILEKYDVLEFWLENG